MSALEAVEHLVGLQAQLPLNPYTGLWSRVERFKPDSLAELLVDRRVVRIVLMRATIHLVSAVASFRSISRSPTDGGRYAG
jgi:winged helix DNA-binding protein